MEEVLIKMIKQIAANYLPSNIEEGILPPENGIPISAALFNMENELLFEPTCNKSVRREKERLGLKQQDKYSNYLTHAEYMLLENNKFEIEEMEVDSINLIISSHPCEHCLIQISKFEKHLRNVYYLSALNKEKKLEKYRRITGKNAEDIDVNLRLFNPFANDVIKNLSSETMKEFKIYMIRMFVRHWAKINFIDKNKELNSITYYKNDIRNYYGYIDLIEWSYGGRVSTKKGNNITIDLKKIRDWDSSLPDDMSITMSKRDMKRTRKALTLKDSRDRENQ